MKLSDHLLLWNHAVINVMDVRHRIMAQGEELRAYRLPASAFLYAVRGSATVWLDRGEHRAKPFHALHGGKGLSLDIAAEDSFEYYMILYKATLPLPCRQEMQALMDRSNPFHHQYAIAPGYPLGLLDQVEQMSKAWQRAGALDKLQVKSLFYQFVHELMRQLHAQGIAPVSPDLTEQAVRYIHERYGQPVALESLAQDLGCSVGHLSKQFKEKMGTSPIHYLGQVRVEQAAKPLLRTDATLQAVAERVGYPDGHSLSRSFKRYKGVSPARFKAEWANNRNAGEELPLSRRRYAILPSRLRRYIDNDLETHYRYRGVGIAMHQSAKLSAMTVLLCLSLLLGACSGATTNTGGLQQTQTPANQAAVSTASGGSANAAQEAAPPSAAEAATRIVSTLKGDVEVPAEPQRVASDQYMGQLLKLGIVPVGVRDGMLTEGWIEKSGISPDVLAGIEGLGGFPMNAEKLISLEPDLIIGSVEASIEQYEKIGTTVFLPYWENAATAGPLEKFRRIGGIFGKQDEADRWIAEFERKVEQAKREIAGIIQEGETVSIVQLNAKTLYVFAAEGGNYGSPLIYQMLQLPPTEQALNMTDGYAGISLEVLPEYMGDYVFYYVGSREDEEHILGSDVWKSIPAVKNGHAYKYGEFGDQFVMEDPYSLELQLDTIVGIVKAIKR